MRISILTAMAMTLVACASNNKGAPTPTAPPSEKPVQTNPSPTASGERLPAPAPESSKVACVHGTDSRVLELRTKGKGCELGYTKSGKESVVATSAKGTDHCSQKMAGIKDKLAKAGFTCQ